SEISIECDQRDVNRQVRDTIYSRQQIDVSSDERALADNADAQPGMLSQDFKNSACHSVATLCRLVRIGCGADDDGLAIEKLEMPVTSKAQRPTEDFGRVALDEDVPLERQPGREIVVSLAQDLGHLLVGGRALHDIAVRVPRVAVG